MDQNLHFCTFANRGQTFAKICVNWSLVDAKPWQRPCRGLGMNFSFKIYKCQFRILGFIKFQFLPILNDFQNSPYDQGYFGFKKCVTQFVLLLYSFDGILNTFMGRMWKIQNLKQFAMNFVAAILIFNFIKKFSFYQDAAERSKIPRRWNSNLCLGR